MTNFADSAATTRSEAPTRPIPAPAALPCTAATTGASPRTSCAMATWNGPRISRRGLGKCARPAAPHLREGDLERPEDRAEGAGKVAAPREPLEVAAAAEARTRAGEEHHAR